MKKETIIGLIPARGGSKGIPKKNIVDLAGQPLIAYVIKAARQTNCINGLYISTEDPEIAQVARGLGVKVIDRPLELALDNTPSLPVMRHALEQVESEQGLVEWILLIQPTYPFIQSQRIREVADLCRATSADSVTTLVAGDFQYHPYNARVLNPDGTASFLFSKEKSRMPNRQSAPNAFFFGNLLASRRETIVANSVYGNNTAFLTIESWEAMDIDSPFDLELAQLLIQEWGGACKPKSGMTSQEP